MHLNKYLIQLLSKYKIQFLIALLIGLAVAVLMVFQAYFLSKIIDFVYLKNKSLSEVFDLIIFLAAVSFIKPIFMWFEKSTFNSIASKIKEDVRNKLVEKLFNLGPNFVKSEKTGDLQNTILNGVDRLDVYFSQFLPQLFLSTLIPILFLIVVFPIDLLSGVVFLVTAPIIIIFMILIGGHAESKSKRQWKSLGIMSAYFLDVIQGLSTIKLFGRSNHILKKVELVSNEFKNSTLKILRIAFLSALVLELFSSISIAIIAVEIGLRLMYGTVEFQPVLFILILAPEFYNPIRQLGTKYHAGIDGISAAESINKILQNKTTENNLTTKNDISFNGDIFFENVSFSYNKDETTIKNFSLQLLQGSKTAIVGNSGAGKTTITNLILKTINPQSGTIKVGGTNLNDIDREKWLENISWIGQRTHLFYGSIKENLLLAKPNATDQEIDDAVKNVNLQNYIKSLPDRYNTEVGERGVKISGGEAQRIAIARAFLKNSPILIMDEPTANLDMETESEILKSLEKLAENKTVIIIAHRLNTITNADQIVVMKDGEIAEQGKYEELVNNNGFFNKLLEERMMEYA